MDTIYIKDLEFIGKHGLFKEENLLGQKFIISLKLKTDMRKAAKTDDINLTTHYGLVAKDVEEIFYSKVYKLIETLAEDIAEKVLLNYKFVTSVDVEIKKPWAPIGIIVDYVSINISRKWNDVYLSLGSNMGEKEKNLEKAIEKISKLDNTFVTKKSKFHKTEPYGYEDQDEFVNACVEIKTLFYPEELIEKLLSIEKEMGRVREFKWGPRLIDLDIIFFNREIINTDKLSVPHPYMHLRSFVLDPLSEIAPNYVHPLMNKTVFELQKEVNLYKMEVVSDEVKFV